MFVCVRVCWCRKNSSVLLFQLIHVSARQSYSCVAVSRIYQSYKSLLDPQEKKATEFDRK